MSAAAGTPILAMPADAASKFVAKDAPSWTKIQASNNRLPSKTALSRFFIPRTLSIAQLPFASSEKKEAGE